MTDSVRLITSKDDAFSSVISELEKALEAAKQGQIDAVVVLARCTNGKWTEWHSGARNFPDMVGKMEIVKHDWIAQYNRESGE